MTAAEALRVAQATPGIAAENWHAAARWLTLVEADATEAEAEARQAVAQTWAGKFAAGLAHAERACLLESRHHDRLVWQPLRDTIAEAVAASSGRTTDRPLMLPTSAMPLQLAT